MHIIKPKNAAQKRAAKQKAAQVSNLQDAQEVIVALTEQNALLEEQLEKMQNSLSDVQEIAVGLLEQ